MAGVAVWGMSLALRHDRAEHKPQDARTNPDPYAIVVVVVPVIATVAVVAGIADIAGIRPITAITGIRPITAISLIAVGDGTTAISILTRVGAAVATAVAMAPSTMASPTMGSSAMTLSN